MSIVTGAEHSAPAAMQTASPAQAEAIGIHAGETLVLAGPGSGKTYVLTAHIETLLERYHVDPSSILVLTFSKAAAISMRARFYKNTRGRYPPIAFGTFHSIFYQIIKRGGNDRLVLIDSVRRYRLLQEIQRQYFPEITDVDDVDALSGIIGRSREQGKPCPRGEYRSAAQIAQAIHTYETYLAENHLIDYDGMILLCRDMLRQDAALLDAVQRQYAFILVDEFQDISMTQYEILRMLYDRERGMRYGALVEQSDSVQRTPAEHAARALFVVGDDDQSIYGFRGADPSICRRFLQDYPSARQILLQTNYRSVSAIVRTAGIVVSENKNRIAKTIVSGRSAVPQRTACGTAAADRPRAVVCKSFADRTAQTRYLIKVIAAMEENTRRESAVVFRTNQQLRLFRRALTEAGLLAGESMDDANPWIQRVCSLYEAYLTLGREARQDCIHRDTYDRIRNVPERFLLRESMPCEQAARQEFLRVYPAGSRAYCAMASLVENAERLLDLPVSQRVRYFRIAIGVEADLVQRANGNERMCRQIREAFELLADHHGRQPDRAHPPESNPPPERRHAQDELQGIQLVTMHACKGLEYRNVYIPDLNEGMIPTRKAHSQEAIEEERRLLYVAMTRAMDHLELLYVKGTRENPGTPTRFLLPLGIGPQYS